MFQKKKQAVDITSAFTLTNHTRKRVAQNRRITSDTIFIVLLITWALYALSKGLSEL